MNKKINKLENLIKNSNFTVVLSGAGVSTSAGIPDFRGKNGIYKTGEYDAAKTFEYRYFVNDPSHFFKFSHDYMKKIENIKPTYTHKFLARLEKNNMLDFIITQNIDGLHQKAGSQNVLQMHGSYQTAHCLNCNKEYNYPWIKKNLLENSSLYCEECGGLVKPNIVFFGEPVKYITKSQEVVRKSNLMLILGSSLTVQPASYLPLIAGGKIVIINKGKIALPGKKFDLTIKKDLDETMKKLDVLN